MGNATISYRYNFLGGISETGFVERTCPLILGGFPHQIAYSLDEFRLNLGGLLDFDSNIADLVDIFLAIAISDRRSPRHLLGQSGVDVNDVARSIEIFVPVRNIKFWSRPELREAVTRLAQLLAGDQWVVIFVKRTRPARRFETQLSLKLNMLPNDAIVALNSGGLDSLFGLAKILARDERSALVAVSVVNHAKMTPVVSGIVENLRQEFKQADIRQANFSLRHNFGQFGRKDRNSEYRTRILVCMAAGIAVAAGLGGSRLQLTENGPGAINLPTSIEQLDSWTTRATHPKTLAMIAGIATQALGREFFIDNMGFFQTKGQMAAEVLGDPRFLGAARLTVSCDRFPYANWDVPCGACMSCLYRRIALNFADGAENDLSGRSPDLRFSSSRRTSSADLYALLAHTDRLRSLLASSDPYRALDAENVRIDEVLSVCEYLGRSEQEMREVLVALYQAFVDDVSRCFDPALTSFPFKRQQAAS